MLSALRPRGFKVTALLGCVRNSIGADAYVSDEVMTSRGGVPVVIGNTDAEGRMVLADMLTALLPDAERAADHHPGRATDLPVSEGSWLYAFYRMERLKHGQEEAACPFS